MGLPLERSQDAAPCVEEKSAFNHLCASARRFAHERGRATP